MRQAEGFSLVELLLAAAISMILVGLLLLAVQGVMNNYTHTQSKITGQADVSFALDQVVQDLESMVIPNYTNAEALALTPETVGSVTNAAWLTLLSTSVDRDNSSNATFQANFNGATRAISYRLSYQDPLTTGGTNPCYGIYRSVASANHTFSNAMSVTNAQTDYWSNIPATPAPTPNSSTNITCFLAENIVGFSLRFLRADTMTWTLPTDQIRIGNDGSSVNGIQGPNGFLRAEVSLTMITPEGSDRVKGGFGLTKAIKRFGQVSVRQTAAFSK